MKKLDDHNNDEYKMYTQLKDNAYTRGAGVLCPKCHAEMEYADSHGAVLACWPPKYLVHCVACGHKDYKVG
jgi:hypothetical protein